MDNFWNTLPKPFLVLAPMDDITDEPWRQMLARHGKPDVTYTEFVSADGLMSSGRERLLSKLRFSENERPIVAQIFGAKPENIKQATALVRELGFDGVDINMGCPDRAIIKQGAGSALIENPGVAREIIRAAKEGAGDMPVAVKTRLGLKKDVLDVWLLELLAERPAAIVVHCRTAFEMSQPPAHWDRIADAVRIAKGTGVKIIGNGDVVSRADALKRAEESGADGVMIGRAAIGNPFVFAGHEPTREDLLAAMVEHAELFEEIFCIQKTRSFEPVRKHLSKYCRGFRGAKELREKVLQAKSAAEVREIVHLLQ